MGWPVWRNAPGIFLLSTKCLQRRILISGSCGILFSPLFCAGGSHCGPFAWAAKACNGLVNKSGIELFVVALLLGLAWEKKENFPGQLSYPGREGSPQEWGGAPRARR